MIPPAPACRDGTLPSAGSPWRKYTKLEEARISFLLLPYFLNRNYGWIALRAIVCCANRPSNTHEGHRCSSLRALRDGTLPSARSPTHSPVAWALASRRSPPFPAHTHPPVGAVTCALYGYRPPESRMHPSAASAICRQIPVRCSHRARR